MANAYYVCKLSIMCDKNHSEEIFLPIESFASIFMERKYKKNVLHTGLFQLYPASPPKNKT